MAISNAKALAAGFSYSPLSNTIDDCLAWHGEHGNPNIRFEQGNEHIGLDRERELEVIEKILKPVATVLNNSNEMDRV